MEGIYLLLLNFCFFSFLPGILCQVSMLSFVGLPFPAKAHWEEFSSGNHSLKLVKLELN